jgi:pyridoxal phosphate enzyme (YggS family)
VNRQLRDYLRENYAAVRHKITEAARLAGRDSCGITLVAVSKNHDAQSLRIIAECGHEDFGESYMREACAKQAELGALDLNWHFVGRLQSNKAKEAVGRFGLVHTIDSARLAEVLHNAIGKKYGENVSAYAAQAVLLQVNIGAEPQKAGISQEGLSALAEVVCSLPCLDLRGLMCLPPVFDAGEKARPFFSLLRELRDQLEARLLRKLPVLSMGMSGDFIWAIAEGASHIRIGSDIFGSRRQSKVL